jgi:hypothetical protein
MNVKSLRKIKSQLQGMRKSPQGRSAGDFESIAKQLGRYKDPRGKEPTYVRTRDPALSPPLSIPKHSGDMRIGTAISIIDALLSDVDDWEIYLQEVEDDDANNDDSTD